MQIALKLLVLNICLLLFANSVLAEKKLVKEYGFVILLDDKCTRTAEYINDEIAAMLHDLHNPVNVWHVTLHQGAYSTSNIPGFQNNLKLLSLTPLNLYFNEIVETQNRWIDFNIKKNPALTKLHEKIVKLTDSCFQRALVRAHDVYSSLLEHQKEQVDSHGTYGVLHDYRPHMTLFYQDPPSKELEHAAKQIAKTVKPIKCKACELAIAELEYNGNISRIIFSVKFP